MLGGIAIGGKADVIRREEIFVGAFVLIEADAENHASLRRDPLLQKVQRGGFLDARRAPSRPEIQDDHFAAQILRKAYGFSIERDLKILGRAAMQAGFALAVIGIGKKREQPDDKRQNQAGF